MNIPILGIIIPKMGINESGSVTIQDALFTSVQQRVLGILFGQPDRRFQGAELIHMAQSGTGAVHRQLTNLAACGLVNVTRIGNQKHYQANPDSPVFKELCGLIRKTVGLREPLLKSLQPYRDRIDIAFVYGSVAKGTDTARSDIDLMIIGDDLDYTGIYDALHEAETLLHRQVNPNLLTLQDWRNKIVDENPFIMKVMEQPKLIIHGSENDLEQTRQSGADWPTQ
ncbi:nucleotidyltransferase domain-containing protein [Candidatus Thiodiazotropha sp. CDECU1]|uniref:nucleotidyltransferase domain-containing protein n=1 Tax=Candidatus Thiodiazotropha sp. CDECU1 TaxID=3065865 RepID=UPI00292F9A87|nr:nucleotidyltransferase domain-containing protein [Candidatus Thiodiazotropha sp. CDECU1]